LIFGLVFVSRDFEVGMVHPLRRVDRQSHTGLIYFLYTGVREQTWGTASFPHCWWVCAEERKRSLGDFQRLGISAL